MFAQCSHGIPPKSGWIGDLRGPHSPIFASRGRRNGEFATSVRSFNIHRLRVRLECVVVAPAYEGGRSPGVQAIVYVLHALVTGLSATQKCLRFFQESVVILEDAAMPGVGVQDEFGARNATCEIA